MGMAIGYMHNKSEGDGEANTLPGVRSHSYAGSDTAQRSSTPRLHTSPPTKLANHIAGVVTLCLNPVHLFSGDLPERDSAKSTWVTLKTEGLPMP